MAADPMQPIEIAAWQKNRREFRAAFLLNAGFLVVPLRITAKTARAANADADDLRLALWTSPPFEHQIKSKKSSIARVVQVWQAVAE